MKVTTDKLLRPSKEELDLLKNLDELYQFGDGSEFDNLVRSALMDDLRRGLIHPRQGGGLDVEERADSLHLRGRYYILKDAELPSEEHRDVFRRLCHQSPAMPFDVDLPGGQVANGQLVEERDFQRLLRCIVALVEKLLGLGDVPERDKTHNLSDDFELK
ncbi:hypothetical protein ISH43_29450 [Pseudomonas aeruginosa]|uniref:hypothetical protein n=1 Tax=Pseudomonas aeruginosa TaxID=287 RepID=UPI001C9DE416|nr:hypothetical protein [Pseudomonas aeruginosa]MBY9724439.1 hypothetical protein [Pseudomonas aeruginosa]QZV52271.1 hypothetical protein KUU73_29745 [Pseudomonas aeruginosa]HCF3656517.1 hypothetical protein [Pseudomonas aeruginosa]